MSIVGILIVLGAVGSAVFFIRYVSRSKNHKTFMSSLFID